MFSHMIASALVLLVTLTDAHITMKTPKPYGPPTTSPLTPANYPCQLTGDPATFYASTAATKIAIGEDAKLNFEGSASHGGGSCQLALTTDLQPSKNTHWMVIKSIEGGCPTTGEAGSGTSEYEFQIPDSIAAGKYTFAWTWQAKLSGVPEFYMNCAPIEVTGGASKRSLNDSMEISSLVKRDGLPDLFVANLQGINDCKTVGTTDPLYPNPGAVVEKPAGTRKYEAAVGTDCCPEGQCIDGGSSGSSSGSGSGSSDGAASSSGAAASSPSASASSQAASSAAAGGDSGLYTAASASPAASSAATSVSIFSVSGFGATRSATAISTKTSAPSGFVTSVTSVASDSAAPFTNTTAAAAATGSSSSGSSPASGSSSDSSSSAGGLTGACTTEGMFNCVQGSGSSGGSYQQCASGAWTALRPLAGTSCKPGQSMTLWRRNQVRY